MDTTQALLAAAAAVSLLLLVWLLRRRAALEGFISHSKPISEPAAEALTRSMRNNEPFTVTKAALATIMPIDAAHYTQAKESFRAHGRVKAKDVAY